MKIQTGDKTPRSSTPAADPSMPAWMATLSHQAQTQIKEEVARMVSIFDYLPPGSAMGMISLTRRLFVFFSFAAA